MLNALGASDFGIFNVVGGAIAMLGFLHAAMSSATQRFMSFYEGKGDREKQKYIFNVSTVLHLGIALLLIVILLIAGYFFFNGILNIPPDRVFAAKVIYGSLILSTAFTVLSVPYEAVLNAHENMLYYSIVGVVESLLKLAVALIIVTYAGDKLVLYGILMAAIPFVIRTIMQVYCHKKYEECVIAPKRYFEKGLMKEMTSFAGWSFFGTASSMISQYGLGIVLNMFFGTVLNAAQGIANQISGQLMTFSNTMLKALNPIIAKSEGSGNRNLMLEASITGCKFSYLLLALFAIPFIFETPYILKLWLKNVPDWAIVFSQLQLVRSLIEQLTVMLGVAISAQGDIKKYTITKSFLNLSPIVLTYLFFKFNYPPYSLYVIWIIAGGILGGMLSLYFTVKQCGLDQKVFFNRVIAPCLGVTTFMVLLGLIPSILIKTDVFRFFSVLISTTIAFILALWFVYLNLEEKKQIHHLLFVIKQRIQKK